MWHYWLIASGIFFVIEILTVGFLIFWLGIGALIAMIVSFFIDNLIIQTAVFVISSTILIFATKPLVNKFVKNKDSIKTNVDSLVGKTGIVTKNIDSLNQVGQIKVGGETWSAIGDNGINIEKGTQIIVKEIKGVKAIVTLKTKDNNI